MNKDYKFTRSWFNRHYGRIERLCGGNPALASWIADDLRQKKVPRGKYREWQEEPYIRFCTIINLLNAYGKYGPCFSPAWRSFQSSNRWAKHNWASIEARRQSREAA